MARGLPRVGATRRVRVGTLSEGISGGIVFALKDRGLFPRWRVPRLAVAENRFYVFCEVWIEDRGNAGFIFVRFGQRDCIRRCCGAPARRHEGPPQAARHSR